MKKGIKEPLNNSMITLRESGALDCKAPSAGNGRSPWQARQRGSRARQAPPEGAFSQSAYLCCTFLTGRRMPAKVRLNRRIG